MMAVDAKFPRALSLSQRARLAFAKSYVARELPGWSRVYRKLIGGYERDDQWTQAPTVHGRSISAALSPRVQSSSGRTRSQLSALLEQF